MRLLQLTFPFLRTYIFIRNKQHIFFVLLLEQVTPRQLQGEG